MKTTVEMKFEVTNGRVIDAKITSDGKLMVEVEVIAKEEAINTFCPPDMYEDHDWN